MRFDELTFLFKSGIENRGICRLDFDEAACLYRSAIQQQPILTVEIGRASGGSTLILASAIVESKFNTIPTLVSIDLTPFREKVTRYHIEQLAKTGIKFEMVVGSSRDYHWFPGKQIDLLFIDGDHSYEGAKHDHDHYGSLVVKGGLVIHHDMGKARPNAMNDSRLIPLKNEIIQSGMYKVKEEAGSLIVFEKL